MMNMNDQIKEKNQCLNAENVSERVAAWEEKTIEDIPYIDKSADDIAFAICSEINNFAKEGHNYFIFLFINLRIQKTTAIELENTFKRELGFEFKIGNLNKSNGIKNTAITISLKMTGKSGVYRTKRIELFKNQN